MVEHVCTLTVQGTTIDTQRTNSPASSRTDNNMKNYNTVYVKEQTFRQMKFPITTKQQMKDLEIELLKTYQHQTGYEIQRHKEEEDNTKGEKRKQKYDMMDTLDKGDKDYKYYLVNRDKL
eukprot:jgi/Psemu1/12177/gm1.12177_g